VHDNIAAVKEASANITQIAEIARLCPDLDIYSGNDDHVLPVLSLGGLGVISTVSNVAPRMMHDLVDQYFAGNITKSRELQFKLNPLVKALFTEVNPIPVKMALNMIGINAGLPRLPLTEMSADKASVLKKELISLGFDIA
jgi:4-hydroxy-tetrahydrodipicolinate synthase